MHSVKKDAQGLEILHKNDLPLFCPFKPSMLVPGRLANEMQIHREPCGSWCPHFQKSDSYIKLTCANSEAFKISEQNKIQI